MSLTLPAIVIDTETSGWATDPEARVVELGAVYVDARGVIMSEFSMVVCPDDPLPEKSSVDKALAVSGLSREDVAAGIRESRVSGAFHDWLRAITDGGQPDADEWLLTSFGVKFDQPMVERMRAWSMHGETFWMPCIKDEASTHMKLTDSIPRNVKGHRKGAASLADAAAHFGLTREGDAHRALSDARLAAEVMVALVRAEAGA